MQKRRNPGDVEAEPLIDTENPDGKPKVISRSLVTTPALYAMLCGVYNCNRSRREQLRTKRMVLYCGGYA